MKMPWNHYKFLWTEPGSWLSVILWLRNVCLALQNKQIVPKCTQPCMLKADNLLVEHQNREIRALKGLGLV